MKIIHVDYRDHDYNRFRKAFAVCSLEDYERMTRGSWEARIHFTPNWGGLLGTSVLGMWHHWSTPSENTLVARKSHDRNLYLPIWPRDELGKPVDFCVLASSVRFEARCYN